MATEIVVGFVKPLQTSTQVVVSTGLNLATNLTQLQDVDNYAGQFNKYARVKTDGTGIEWVDVENQVFGRNVIQFANGTTYNTYVDNGKTKYPFLRIDGKNYLPIIRDGIAFTITSETITDNGDGTIVVTTSGGNKTFSSFDAEAVPASELSMSGLNDVDDFSTQDGKVAKVKTGGTGIEFQKIEDESVALDTATDTIKGWFQQFFTFMKELGKQLITATGSTTERSLEDRFADTVHVKDFGAIGDGVADDTAAINAAYAAAPENSQVVFCGGTYNVSNRITVTRHTDLGGCTISQQNTTSDTVRVVFGGSIKNGTILANNSNGVAVEIDGDSAFFIGRDRCQSVLSAIAILGNPVNQPVSSSRGTGLLFSALSRDGNESYISGISVDVDIAYFTKGLDFQTVSGTFINSNHIRANINRCRTMLDMTSGMDLRQYNIGVNYFELNLQIGNDTVDVMNLECFQCVFKGNLWDLNAIAEPHQAVHFRLRRPAAPWQNAYAGAGNRIEMFGCNTDRCYGSIDGSPDDSAVTVQEVLNLNSSNIKQAFAQQSFISNKTWRKTQNGIQGEYDTIHYTQAVDSWMANADKRFLVLSTRTNQTGANLGGISPVSGYSLSSMFTADSKVTRYEPGDDWIQIGISFKEGAFPVNSILADMVGIKLLSQVRDIIFEAREAGQSTWTEIYSNVGSYNKREFLTRFNPFGGSVNQLRAVALDGIRIRFYDPSQVYEIENLFLMSPTEKGKDYVDSTNAMIMSGNLNMAENSSQGIVMRSPDGSYYKVVMKNTGILEVEPYTHPT